MLTFIIINTNTGAISVNIYIINIKVDYRIKKDY